jgi:tetratricopeptide (TPR) repeat protein
VRALLGPLNPRDQGAIVADRAALDILCFDRAGADVAFDPGQEALPALFSRLPAGWRPDCLIWWSPEYSLLPEGIERCPVPSIAVLGDWNLGIWTTAPLLEAFDWVVTDRPGVQALGPQLEVPVDRWPAFSFDARVHRRLPDLARDIDVLFVGNMNHEVQVDRARWLAALARLGDRHRVVLASGVYGQAYARLLNRARIVWNRSIRGEMNMRAYEAPACGALLFMEEENAEVRDVLGDGLSCVLYDEDSLAPRLEECLANPERCARVAEAGWRRIQAETYAHHLHDLLREAGALRLGPRGFARLAPWRRDYWLALHAMCSADPGHVAAAGGHLARALRHAPDAGAMAAALGVLAVHAAGEVVDARRQALLAEAGRLLVASLAADPDDVVTRGSLAWLSAMRGDRARAREHWTAVHAALERGAPFPVDRIPLPFAFDRFRVEWERAALEPDLEGRRARLRPLLAARAAAEVAAMETDGEAACRWWTASARACSGIEGNVLRLAQALEASGDADGAIRHYAQALDVNPFDGDARRRAAALAAARGDRETVERLAADGRLLAAAASGHMRPSGAPDAESRIAAAEVAPLP